MEAIAPRSERPDMADYGVPSDPAGTLDWDWAVERLVPNKNYWVVTVSAQGQPAAMPVNGVWFESPSRFVFSCSPNSRRVRNIEHNPKVVVMVDSTVEVVSVEGIASALTDISARKAAAEAWAQKFEPEPEKREASIEFVLSNAMFEVTPLKAYAIIETEAEFAAKATRWVLHAHN